jgi:hypothetical protein
VSDTKAGEATTPEERQAWGIDTTWGAAEVVVRAEDEQTMWIAIPEDSPIGGPHTATVIEDEMNNHVPWKTGMVAMRVTTEDGENFLTLTPDEARSLAWSLWHAAAEAEPLVPTVKYEA